MDKRIQEEEVQSRRVGSKKREGEKKKLVILVMKSNSKDG